ncbi:odorant receptor 67d-like [Bactrocera neohumeralis]|uniref:odorant receptor 67d-like n=1 Tax=Bactrocera tryoni TaxID=59916 RepID=UPI001A97C779|nr:odorant receptor 67d-like [Bactrocera tryoni]XP_050336226.1 odorant receptor 67d-like [Bactrocera neohumeralis]
MTIKHISPTASFAKLIKTVRFISSLVGADVSTENYQVNIITIIVIVCIIIYFIFTATTVASVFSENWTYLLEASCMVGSVLQGITKLISGISKTNQVSGMRLELEELYRVYESKGESYCKVMNACCDRVWQVIKMVGLIYGAAIVGNLLLTSFMVFFANQKVYIMHFFIPGVDVETSFGYLLTTALHSLCFLAGAFGLFGGDLFFLIYLGQPELFRDILILKVHELNEAAAQKDNKTESLLISIIEWHQYYTDYNERCNELFYYIITMQILTSGVSIVFTMYIILMGDWPGAYLYILIALSGLYLYCIIGTNIQTCNETFFEELYNINWYELDVKGRKMMILVLMKSQNPSEIKIGGVLPLSVQTALQITKTIYGIFTMMLGFLDEEQ